jgi:hypothetical protein
LYNNEKEKNYLISRNEISQIKEYYLIDISWIENYKNLYNYNALKSLWDTKGKNIEKNELFSLFENIKLNDSFQKEII